MTREEELFSAAVEMRPDERLPFLARQCGDDQTLQARVEALLADFDEAGGFFDRSIFPRREVATEVPGQRVGRYTLLEKIGEGGCGTVWMARQEEPVRRRVALKVIKLGMDTNEMIARFDAERQALALMEHPNIARVLDAGATEAGRPYFVMELVHGPSITRYCDDGNVPTAQRLALFVQVCRAVHHAHEKGVVHRDIKPSNILVTQEGGEPLPKVIDFGVAKATQGRLTDRTLFTAFEQFIGTPAYMSPEQADYHASEIDARSDVYSLGALLYELLAGRPPFDPTTLTAHGMEETRRIIREVEPPRPSTKLNTLSHAERTTLAQRRGLAPAAHALAMRGDLDWIAMKALEKNRARRYDSAAALADDIRRYLEHRPVLARAPSGTYGLRKFVRRHRVGLAAVGCASLGIAIAVWQADRARRAELARVQLEKGAIATRVAEALKQAPPRAPERTSAAALVRAREFVADVRENFLGDSALAAREDWIEARAQEAIDAFDRLPVADRDAAWRRERGYALARLSLAQRLQANTAGAIAHAEQAREELEAAIAAGDRSVETTLLLAMICLVAYEPVLTQRVYGPHPEAPQHAASLLRAEALLQPLLDGEGSVRARQLYAEVLLARAPWRGGEASWVLAQQALALFAGSESPEVRLTRARILTHLGRHAEAAKKIPLQQEAIALSDVLLADSPESPASLRVKFWAFWGLAEASRALFDNSAELAQLAIAEQIATRLLANDPLNDDNWYALLMARASLHGVLIELGRVSDALAVSYQTAIDAGHPASQPMPVEGGPRRYVKGVLERIAVWEAQRGNFAASDRAAAAHHIHVASLKVAPGASARAGLVRDRVVAERYARQIALFRGDYDSVIAAGERMRLEFASLLGGPASREADRVVFNTEVAALGEHLAEAFVQVGRFSEAEKMIAEILALRPRNSANTMRERIFLALAIARMGRAPEARATLANAMHFLKPRYEKRTANLEQRQLYGQALVVEAAAQEKDDAGRARRLEALAQAQSILDGMTAEARQLYASRVLAKWLAEERTKG